MSDRKAIRKVFLANRGSISEIAREIGVNRVTVILWLKGKREVLPEKEAAIRARAVLLREGV